MGFKTLSPLERTLLVVLCVIWIVIGSGMIFYGCAPVKGLSGQDTILLRAYAFYNNQFDSYQLQTADPSKLSEEQRDLLQKKHDVLVEMHRVIKLYELAINSDNPENVAQLEQQIYELIGQLGGQL